ncbi:GNAT family N-acetyltransferase [Macrococcus brunensis]|uniref:GNAT family N-acetyltransferase n=1 Tax=Macrococcus brunensis TaxID=198483 RepID=UPI001EEFA200|nr:GNAT family N-acetyltransferase [Macrococcus brunensis]ULG75116.1 GNAT family N-acetyltransferase [Macrococcus brunensis]
MNHTKTYYRRDVQYQARTFVIEGPVSGDELSHYSFDDGLSAFRRPAEQFAAIKEIADLPEGRIIICRDHSQIIAYVTFLYPDPLERWSEGNLPFLMELGAIEVALPYRSLGIGKEMLKLAMLDDQMEDYIIITTEYYWHWDLKNSGLSVFEYKDVMRKMMEAGGMEVFATNDPEITSHPANSLMARIGSRINNEQIEQFDNIRFINRFFF